jgi:hypothetical protein
VDKAHNALLARLAYALAALRHAAEIGYPWLIYPAEAAALVAEVERLRGERAAVVAFLREWQNTMDDRITHDDLDYAATMIERGEHRREEDE